MNQDNINPPRSVIAIQKERFVSINVIRIANNIFQYSSQLSYENHKTQSTYRQSWGQTEKAERELAINHKQTIPCPL
jgi:hypothetical protein